MGTERVTVAATRVAGMADHVTVAATHDGLLRDAATQFQVISFLRNGRFSRGEPAAR